MNPLTDPVPAEVPLAQAPLANVLGQLRFPLVASINDPAFIGPFQEAIRKEYPVLRPEQTQAFLFAPGGPTPGAIATTWRFTDNAGWRVTLTHDFLTLDTNAYASRADFLERLQRLWVALRDTISPSSIDRLGIRYIDQVVGAGAEDMTRMIRGEVLGISGTSLAGHASHVMTESSFRCDHWFLLARWGHMPAGATVDPGLLPPGNEPSWILDLDAYVERSQEFNVKALIAEAQMLTERCYAFFRWAVTAEFLKRYGGQP